MSSTGQATLSTENVKLIIDALANYAKETGIDLSKNPFATNLEQFKSSEDILQLLEDREKAFKEYRDKSPRLINCLSPIVNVFHKFSGILSKAVSLVHFSPAGALFAVIDTLLSASSKVSSSYDALLELFEHLGSFVKRMDIYTKIDLTPIMVDMIVKIMVELLSVFSLATKQITQGRIKKFAKKLLGESEIEAVLRRLDRLTKNEAQIGVAQTMGVVHGLVGNVKLIMEDREASMDNIRQELGALHRGLTEINKTRRDQLQRDVKEWLSPPDPSTNHILISNARHNGTAAWLFKSETLKEWNTRGSFLWIHGKPGAGKSTLLSAIIENIEDKHLIGLAKMAYYYFDFRDDKKQNLYGLLSSLILQLSAESDPCFNILFKLYSGNNRVRKPAINALKNCMKEMLSQSEQGPIYIIIDGLDECPNSSGTPSPRREVLELINELVGLKHPDVHICVASRPEIDIRTTVGSLKNLRISLDDEIGQKADIITVIEHTVHSNSMPEWTEEDQSLVVNTISQKANGMFRWVACQMDNVLRCYSNDIQGALDDMPEDLDETYERTLRTIDNQKRKYAKRLFQCLSVSIRPLRVEELADIFAVQFDVTPPGSFNKSSQPRNAEWAVLSACSCLITTASQGESQVVQFSHSSVKEFLTSERLANAEGQLPFYHILPGHAHTTLAYASLSVLLQLDDKIGRDIISRIPLAPYAARHWIDHARYCDVSLHVQELMERLFDPRKSHFSAWVWLHNIDCHWIKPMSEIHPTRPNAEPLYYASLCGFRDLVGRLLVSHSPDINCRGGSHTTPLHAAAVKGHVQVTSLLLKSGADPNSRDIMGMDPLHRVSQGGQLATEQSLVQTARLLVNCGANVNAANNEGMTPLHAAAQGGYHDIAELLLGSGASLDALNNKQETPLLLACATGKLEVSRLLIERGSDIKSRTNNDLIPLHAASRFGHVKVARALLDCGSDVNARSTGNETPLHLASYFGHLDIARLLIDYGADVNARKARRRTPIHLASARGYLDTTKLLVERGANVNSRCDDGNTPLGCAAGNGFLDISRFLVERGADVDSQNNDENTPLGFAAGNGSLDISRFLVESGASVFSRDKKGWTPFHKASACGHLHIAKFLLESGVSVDVRSRKEQTSLGLASSGGHLDVVHLLIEYGADIRAKDSNGWNPVHIASKNGHSDVVRSLVRAGVPVDLRNGQTTPLAFASGEGKVEVVRCLIELGADLYAGDNQNWIPLHYASRHGHTDIARLMLDNGVDVNAQESHLQSPLHLTAIHGHVELAQLLIQRGATIDLRNNRRETPLDRAAGNGKADVTHLLIDHGAKINITDSNGWTPLHSASSGGHLDVVKLLLRHGADIEARNDTNQTPEYVASWKGESEVANFLAEYKSDADVRNKIRSNTSDSAQYGADEDRKYEKASLFDAAEEGSIDLVDSLLELGVDVNDRNEETETPLMLAALNGNAEVVRLLIERGAEVNSCDEWGRTPLHCSSADGNLEISRVLLDHGANVNARMYDYWTPLLLAAVKGYSNTEMVALLLERGADVHAVNREGKTPYQLSLRTGSRGVADLIRKHGG